MSAERNDGGPAFPVSPEESRGKVSSIHGGMTLRDYFAAKALERLTGADPDGVHSAKTLATCAYALADAMLKARQA